MSTDSTMIVETETSAPVETAAPAVVETSAPDVEKAIAERRAWLQARREEVMEEAAKLERLAKQADILNAQEQIVSFLGGKVLLAVEFPMSMAGHLIPARLFRIHLLYSDNDKVFYASDTPRWMPELPRHTLVCGMRDEPCDLLADDVDQTVLELAVDMLDRSVADPGEFQVIDLPYGEWKDFKSPSKCRSFVSVTGVGPLITKRDTLEKNVADTIAMFSMGMWLNPNYEREMVFGGITITLK